MDIENMTEIKKCEYCGKEINKKYMICPLCGGHLHEGEKFLTPECPRCKVLLTVHFKSGEEYDICPKCGGLWLDRGEFRLFTREYDVYRKDDDKGEYLGEPSTDPL